MFDDLSYVMRIFGSEVVTFVVTVSMSHGCSVVVESNTIISISIQNNFRVYKHGYVTTQKHTDWNM